MEADLLEASGRAYFTYCSATRWLAFYVDMLSLVFTGGCLLATLFSHTSAALSSLALASVIQVLGVF